MGCTHIAPATVCANGHAREQRGAHLAMLSDCVDLYASRSSGMELPDVARERMKKLEELVHSTPAVEELKRLHRRDTAG